MQAGGSDAAPIARVAARARARAMLADGVERLGPGVALWCGVALLGVLAGRLVLGAGGWVWASVVVGAGVFGGVAVAFGGAAMRRRSRLRAVALMDARLALRDRLGSALALSAGTGGNDAAFVSLAVAEGRRVAQSARARAAWPLRRTRWHGVAAVVGALAAGSVFLPARSIPDREAEAAEQARAEAAAAVIEEAAAELASATDPAVTGDSPDATPRDVQAERELAEAEARTQAELARLAEELRSGAVSPEDAAAEAAAELEGLAEAREQAARAAEAGEASDTTGAAFSEAARAFAEDEGGGRAAGGATTDEHVRELAESLSAGDLDAAADAAGRLAEDLERMSAAEREAARDELERLAEALDPAPADTHGAEQGGRAPPDAAERAAEASGASEGTQGQPAGDEPKTPTPAPSSGSDRAGEQAENDRGPGSPGEEQGPPQSADRAGEHAGDPAEGQAGSPTGGQAGEQAGEPTGKSAGEPTGEPTEKGPDEPGTGNPAERGGEQPGTPAGGTPESTGGGDARREVAEALRQTARAADPGRTSPAGAPGTTTPSDPNAAPQGGGAAESTRGEPEPPADPRAAERALRELAEAVERGGPSPEQVERARQLREGAADAERRAGEMLERMMPEQREQARRLAEQWAQQAPEQGTSQPDPVGSGPSQAGQDRPEESWPGERQPGGSAPGRSGADASEGTDLSDGAGRPEGIDRPDGAGPGAGPRPSSGSGVPPGTGPGADDAAGGQMDGARPAREFSGATDPVDARARDGEAPRERLIAEWYGDGVDAGRAAPAAQEELRRAADAAERAVEQQRVPPRYRRLVREVFGRLDRGQPGGQGVAPAGTEVAPAGEDAPARPVPPGGS